MVKSFSKIFLFVLELKDKEMKLKGTNFGDAQEFTLTQ